MDIKTRVKHPLTGQKIIRTINLCNAKLKLHSEVVNNVEVIHTVERQEY